MALLIACGGCRLRAENTCRSGNRSISSSISAPGLRLIWPPSGNTCARSSSISRRAVGRNCRDWPAGRARRKVSAINACRRGRPSRAFFQIAAQVTHLPRQTANEAAIETRVGILQHERRLAEPADDAARQDLRLPADRMPAALLVDPVVDQRARIGAGDRRIGGAQMTQPGEAAENAPPIRQTAASSRTACGGRRSPPCPRRRSGRRRFRRRGWRRRCAGPAGRDHQPVGLRSS